MLSFAQDGTKVLHLVPPSIVVNSTAYVATISFVCLCPFIRVILVHKPLVIQLVKVVLLGVCLVLLTSATISPTFVMTTLCIPALCLVMLFILEVRKRLDLCDGFIYGLDLSLLQLRLGPILQSVHEVKQHVLLYEVGKLKR